MRTTIIAILGVILIGFTSCDLVQPVMCTEQFEVIGVEITGQDVDQTFTLTGTDTLQNTTTSFSENTYTVIDDSNQGYLEGQEVEVVFHGYLDGSLVIKETYVVGADECHVYLVSGKTKIEL